MILAKNKNGQIGRQVPRAGLQAQTSHTPMGERRGQLYLSTHSIAADQAYYGQKEKEERAYRQAQAITNRAKKIAQAARQQAKIKSMGRSQFAAKFDPMNEKLKTHFARTGAMGETAQVMASVLPAKPADFSSSGANPQYVRGSRMTGGDEWRADFRMHRIVGNPLTRDGVFGPAVTDYERFVNGRDVNQEDVVQIAGGTMLGRNNGQQLRNGMGFDWSWGGITDALSNVVDQTTDNLVDKLPEQLAQEIQNAVNGGGSASQQGSTVVITRPVQAAVNTVSQTIGLPPWAIYTGVGILGVGLVFVMIKAVKS